MISNCQNQASMIFIIKDENGCLTKQMECMNTRMGTLEAKVAEDFGKFDSRIIELEVKINAESRRGFTSGFDAGDRGGTGGH